jgi:hypothetical protein
MTYHPDKFAYEQDQSAWIDFEVIGHKYNSDAIILEVAWHGDDHMLVLMVEEDADHPGEPFVIVRLHLDALDVRHEVQRMETFRDAFIMWNHLT